MKHLIALMLAVLSNGPVTGAPLAVDSASPFALDLYSRLRTQPGNLFVSPYSLDRALRIVQAGADGNTLDEMNAVLLQAPDEPADGPHAAPAGFAADLQAESAGTGYALSVANAVWVEKRFSLLPAYTDLLRSRYRAAAVKRADFADGAAATAEISARVAGQTDDRVKDLIPPDAIGGLTRLVLVNAIYFKGQWVHPFNQKVTRATGHGTLKTATPCASRRR